MANKEPKPRNAGSTIHIPTNVKDGYICPACGTQHVFPHYVYAHWDTPIQHACDCGALNTLIQGSLPGATPKQETSNLQLLVAQDTGAGPGEGRIRYPAYTGDAGFDLAAHKDTRCTPGLVTNIPVGIKVALPDDLYGMIIGRSSANRGPLVVITSIIDNGYRGPLFVMARNLSPDPIVVEAGMCIAQLIPLPVLTRGITITAVDELPDSERGSSGFGSSGDSMPRREIEVSETVDYMALARRSLEIGDGWSAIAHLENWLKDHPGPTNK